jgi:chromosome partitioning protein
MPQRLLAIIMALRHSEIARFKYLRGLVKIGLACHDGCASSMTRRQTVVLAFWQAKGDGLPIITLAQTKGGSGKTTTAEVLIAEFTHRGLTVAAIDLDPNRPLGRFTARAPALADVQVAVPNDNMRVSDLIANLSSRCDIVVIDLMGAATPDMMVAIGFSDLVLVPSQLSEPDVRCGIETWRMIQEVEKLGRREIAKAVLLTRTSPALRTRAQEHARLQYEKVGVKVLETEFMERVAFKEMTFNGAAPNIQDRESNAAKNVITMFNEIIRMLPGQEISRQAAAAQ